MSMTKVVLRVMIVVLGLTAGGAQAGISLGQTRLVYPQSSAAQSITLRNTGSEFYLVEAAVTDWATQKPAKAFSILPPLFRLEGRSENVLRVVRTGGDLPQDRESVFRLRVNAIPGSREEKTTSAEGAKLAVSLGMGIKLFYRPDGLKIKPEQAMRALTFTREGQGVVIANPTPYYLTFATLTLGGQKLTPEGSQAMLSPFSEQSYLSKAAKGAEATWSNITDYGGVSDDFHAIIH